MPLLCLRTSCSASPWSFQLLHTCHSEFKSGFLLLSVTLLHCLLFKFSVTSEIFIVAPRGWSFFFFIIPAGPPLWSRLSGYLNYCSVFFGWKSQTIFCDFSGPVLIPEALNTVLSKQLMYHIYTKGLLWHQYDSGHASRLIPSRNIGALRHLWRLGIEKKGDM